MARPKGHTLSRDAFEEWSQKHLGQSLTQIADAADIPRATLSGLLGGFTRASVPMAHKLADAMGVRVGALFPTLSSNAARFTEATDASAVA